MIRNYEELRERLAFYVDDEYRVFAMKGIPSERPLIGVRMPDIRKIVNNIDLECYTDILAVSPVTFEEVVVRGILICKLSYEEMLKYFDSQISYIDNWAACDLFCSGLRKVISKNRGEFLDSKIEKLLNDSREFVVRVGLVILKCVYMDFDYLNLIFDRVEKLVLREEYYIRMAIAWLLAECFIKFPEETFVYLKVSHLPKWTFNKTISKICDSYRVEDEAKEMIKKIRKK